MQKRGDEWMSDKPRLSRNSSGSCMDGAQGEPFLPPLFIKYKLIYNLVKVSPDNSAGFSLLSV